MGFKDKWKFYCAAAVLGFGLIAAADSYFVADNVTTTINGTEVKRYKDKDLYLIFTDAGTFKNTDCFWRFKFNSSDVQGLAKKLTGHKAELKKYGWRSGLFSMYENVTKIKEASEIKTDYDVLKIE